MHSAGHQKEFLDQNCGLLTRLIKNRHWRNRSEGQQSPDSVEKQGVDGGTEERLMRRQAVLWSRFLPMLQCRKDLCQFAEVLGGGGKEEFVVRTAWAA